MPVDEFRELNGLRHHLLRWPPHEGAPHLLLVHGYLDLAWSFAPLAAALLRRVRLNIVALDLRGHGESEWVQRGGYYHFADYVADLHPLVQSLPRPRFLLGHSMGGSIAALLAGAFPEAVDRLVLAEGLGPPSLDEDPPERLARWIREVDAQRSRPVKPLPDLAAVRDRLRAGNPRLGEELATFLAEKGTREVPGGRRWSFDPLHRTRSPLGYTVPAFRSFLPKIAAPTLLLKGEHSGFEHWITDDREGELANAERQVIPGVGHMMHHDDPEAMAEAVAAFLTR